MNKKIFFGLVRKSGANVHGFSEPELELYLINDSDNPVTVKNKSFGGFVTYDDTVAMFSPQNEEADIIIEPHGYILYTEVYEYSDGVGQYQASVEIEGSLKMLEIYSSSLGSGFMGSLLPCVNKRGRVIYPRITEQR